MRKLTDGQLLTGAAFAVMLGVLAAGQCATDPQPFTRICVETDSTVIEVAPTDTVWRTNPFTKRPVIVALPGDTVVEYSYVCKFVDAPPFSPQTNVRKSLLNQRNEWIGHYARRFGVDSALAVRVADRENDTGQPDRWSQTRCCVGAMQVNLLHYGQYSRLCDGNDLYLLRDNVCYGVGVLSDKLRICSGDVECALQRYGGWSQRTANAERYIRDIMEGL